MSLGRDGVAGLILFGISLALFVQTFSLPHLPLVPVGPGFYPRIVLAFLALASAGLVLQDLLKRRPAGPAHEGAPAAPVRRNYRGVVVLFAIVSAFIAFLPLLGFRIATALFVAAAQATIELPRTPRAWAVLAIIGAATAAVTHLVFENYLLVLLPRGAWTGW
jgi:putative tricarboxylic transport membrane protein